MTKLIINGFAGSTFVRTARMACVECGIDHELRPIGDGTDVFAALKHPDYLKKHPFGRMPTLEDGDRVVFETTAISRYVSEKYGNGRLVPGDLDEATRMEEWISASLCYIIPDVVGKFIGQYFFRDEPDPDAIKEAKPILRQHFEILDRALEGRTTLAGGDVTVADLLLTPPLHYVGHLPDGMELFDGLDNLGRWWYNIVDRPSCQQTVPEFIAEKLKAA